MFRCPLHAVAVVAALAVPAAFAHEAAEPSKPAASPADAGAVAAPADAAAPEMSEEEKAMMEAWTKAMTPGPHHAALEPLVGTFDVKLNHWMAEGTEASTSTGLSHHAWTLGNRYLEQRYEGSFDGQPFQGIGYTGYDNILGTYFGTWMDSMSTGIMTSTGKAESPTVINFDALMSDPMTGTAKPVREKLTITSADAHVLEMWTAGPDGKEFRMMEILYTRKK